MPDTKDLLTELREEWLTFAAREDERKQRLDELELRMERQTLERQPVAVSGHGPFLDLKARMAPHFRDVAKPDYDVNEVRVGALLAALAHGDVIKHLNDAERKAFAEGSNSAGGYLVPSAVGSLFIDSVRPKMQVLAAGARSYPMEAGTVTLPGWDTPPTAAWRAEAGAVSDAGGTFKGVTLAAKSIATKADVSIEMLEDAGSNLPAVEQIISSELAKAIAQAVDLSALMGSGSGQPLGLNGISGVNSVVYGTGNGAAPTDYDKILDANAAVRTAGFEPNALLWAPRTQATFAKLVTGITGDKTKLAPPAEVAAMQRLATAQLPVNLTVGTSSDCSIAFAGDWTQLVIGFRPTMTVKALTDPYTKAGTGQVTLYAFLRVDVAALNAPAFAKLTGIRP